MNRLKAVLPSLRQKKRYLVVELISESKLTINNYVFSQLEHLFRNFLGDVGLANAGIIVFNDSYNPKTQRLLVKVSNKYLDKLRASLCFLTTVAGISVIARSVYASGMISKAKAYL